MPEPVSLPAGVTVFERGWLSANNIFIAGARGTVLVDSGYCTHAAQTRALVDQALGGRPLNLLVNSHLHSDHCGGNSALQSQYPALQTLIPPGQAAQVRDWDPVALSYVPTGQECPEFSITGVLRPGAEILLGDDSWEIHAAPGHDAHSIILFEPRSRTLISADALWENGFGVVFQELEGDRAFEEVALTLDLIGSLKPSIVIPGHGRVFTDVRSALSVARSRLEGFVADPKKHASHAAKVLLKFKLLEIHQIPYAELLSWANETAYFGLVHRRWFTDQPLSAWIEQSIGALARSGALELRDNLVINS